MPYENCQSCNGSGTVAESLNPYGQKHAAGMGRIVCHDCRGMGKIRVPDSRKTKARPVNTEFSLHVWFFGLVTAFFFGMLQPWDLWWPLAAGLGFAVGSVGAAILGSFKVGRYILISLAVALALFVVVGILTSG